MRKWLGRLSLTVLFVALTVLAAGVAHEAYAKHRAFRDFPPPGSLVEFDGRQSHIHCTGEGAPTVLLESGLGTAGSQSWRLVQPALSATTKVCSYDRAGLMWSEARPDPRDAERITDELHSLLDAAAVGPPYVLVGHSLGGLLTRVYDQRYPGEVVGFVFVDSSHPEQWGRYSEEVVRYVDLVEGRSPSPWVARVWSRIGGYRLTLPPARSAVSAMLPNSVPWGFLGERAARNEIFGRAGSTGSLGDRPIHVLSAGEGAVFPGLSDALVDDFNATWRTLQAELAQLSTDSKHDVVDRAGHNIQIDRPGAVVAATLDVLSRVRDP